MTGSAHIPEQLLDAITARFGTRWKVTIDGPRLTMTHTRRLPGYCHAAKALSAGAVLQRIECTLRRHGVRRADLLPLRWGRDTDLTISGVQALDPWLKDGAARVWREGYLPQPVVRFTGDRDAAGRLRDGFLTSFVNISCVQRIGSIRRHVGLIDAWIDVFSALGVHASRLALRGSATVWRRGPVEGVTLFVDCDDANIGDAVLLWHAGKPALMASDIGSGLERLRWVIGGTPWRSLIHSDLGDEVDSDVLDAVRTATLLLMSGVRPAGRGAGAAVRRVARRVPRRDAALGLSRAVRVYHSYWTEVGVRGIGWPQAVTLLEDAVLHDSSADQGDVRQ